MYPVEEYEDTQFLRAEVPRAASLVREEEKDAHGHNRYDQGSATPHAFSGKRKRLVDFLEEDGGDRTQVAAAPATPTDQEPVLQSITQAVGAFVAAYKAEGARQDRQAARRRIQELEDKSRDYRRIFVEYPDKFSIVGQFYKSESEKMQAEILELKKSL